MFKNFFGKKKDGFYLQIEEDNTTSKPAAKAKATEPAAAPTPTAVETTTAAPVAKAAPADTTAPAAKAAPAAKVEKKSAKKVEDPKVETPKVEAAPAPAAPITTFATDYLIKPSSSSSRRLPGANMKGFLDLARQVKKPVNIK